jgi:hypothetical protein
VSEQAGARWVRLEVAELEEVAPDPPEDYGVPPEAVVAMPPPPRRWKTPRHAADVALVAGSFAEILGHALDGGRATDLPVSGETLLDWLPPMYRMPLPSPEERAAEQARAAAGRRGKKKRPLP